MTVDMDGADLIKLIDILETKQFVINIDELRLALTSAGLPTLIHQINIYVDPRTRIRNAIQYLMQVGKDDYGHEALGRFLNYLIDGNYVADKNQKMEIKDLINKYEMMPPISVSLDMPIADNINT